MEDVIVLHRGHDLPNSEMKDTVKDTVSDSVKDRVKDGVIQKKSENYPERFPGKGSGTVGENGLVDGLVEWLVENQKRMLEMMKVSPTISKKEMSHALGISTTAIDKNIQTLKKKGLLKRIGPAKGGHWEVVV